MFFVFQIPQGDTRHNFYQFFPNENNRRGHVRFAVTYEQRNFLLLQTKNGEETEFKNEIRIAVDFAFIVLAANADKNA